MCVCVCVCVWYRKASNKSFQICLMPTSNNCLDRVTLNVSLASGTLIREQQRPSEGERERIKRQFADVSATV